MQNNFLLFLKIGIRGNKQYEEGFIKKYNKLI